MGGPRHQDTQRFPIRSSWRSFGQRLSRSAGLRGKYFERRNIQRILVDEQEGTVSFIIGNTALLGLGEGGPQFDRRGSIDAMRSGQGGYRLATHGGRVPVPWIIGTRMGAFLSSAVRQFRFLRHRKANSGPSAIPCHSIFSWLPLGDPKIIMAEYARLTGFAEKPPLWSFGYQQSHRTLASREEVLEEAKTFREKKLPCDTMIYLGTGFCPSGWNTENGSFAWNSRVFPIRKESSRNSIKTISALRCTR